MALVRATEKRVGAEILVVGFARTKRPRSEKRSFEIESGDMAIDKSGLIDALADMGATGDPDEVIKLPASGYKLLVLTGLGDKSSSGIYSHERLRRASGAAARSLHGQSNATFSLPYDSIEALAAIAEGALLGAYTFDEFRGSSKSEHLPALKSIEIFTVKAKKKEVVALFQRAEIIAEQVHLTRDLVNTPPSHLNPDSMAQRLKKIAVASGLKVEILNHTQLKAKGFGGITGVGQGSANPPRLVHISYLPKGRTNRNSNRNSDKKMKRFAFVGKGITFDTGGLALKPALGMQAMKSDMSGAAAVVSAVIAIAKLKLNIAVDAWAPLAENMASDKATRPSDVIKIYGGKSVEVINPDAEGRLILADALVRAAEVGKKAGGLDGIIDVATLTGAQVIALGTRTSAVMTNNEKFREIFLEATTRSGEQFWPMPLPEELRPSLDSPVADLANVGDRMGGMLVAGLFLKEFVNPQLPWLHLDIAGPAFNEGKAHGYTSVGGTGVAVHSLIALAEALATS
jgi:leucyl aminopeptidase